MEKEMVVVRLEEILRNIVSMDERVMILGNRFDKINEVIEVVEDYCENEFSAEEGMESIKSILDIDYING